MISEELQRRAGAVAVWMDFTNQSSNEKREKKKAILPVAALRQKDTQITKEIRIKKNKTIR